MLLFLFDGLLLLLRFAERQLLALLFQLPPRCTRFEPEALRHHPRVSADCRNAVSAVMRDWYVVSSHAPTASSRS